MSKGARNTDTVKTLKHVMKVLRNAGLIQEDFMLNKEEMVYPQMGVDIEYITDNSRQVRGNTLFFCKGRSFKIEYLADAITRGAICYISERPYKDELREKGLECLEILIKDVRKAMSIVADDFYEKPWESLVMVGITGTKGKSTTAYFLKSIFDKAYGNMSNGLISSIANFDGNVLEESHLTTPEPIELIELIGRCRDNGCRTCTMEVSSQGLKYGRTRGVIYDYGVFLNISEDHISESEHKDFEDYFFSKLKIFSQSKCAILSIDSDLYDMIGKSANTCSKMITVSKENKDASYYASHIQDCMDGLNFKLHYGDKTEDIHLGLSGAFNVENALVSIAIARDLGISLEDIKDGLSNIKVPGRMEMYRLAENRIIGIVDYAHNKLSFEKLLSGVENTYKGYKKCLVFGCPGGKAINRRVDLPKVAARYVDKVVITDEDPNLEDHEKIAKEVSDEFLKLMKEGACSKDLEIVIKLDREKALEDAISSSKESGEPWIIMATGKGDEENQKVGGKYVYYKSDSRIFREHEDGQSK